MPVDSHHDTIKNDLIVAPASAVGAAGVGVIRVSGSLDDVQHIASSVLGRCPEPRKATYGPFVNQAGDVIDHGVALFYPEPHSFTGESVLELQGHGGRVVMQRVIQSTIDLGARMALPGEFSERAFCHGKVDLAQAEAIADLIHANSEQAAIAACRSLEGVFSKKVDDLVAKVRQQRIWVEAHIDFSDEGLQPVEKDALLKLLLALKQEALDVKQAAQQGAILQHGIQVALIGDVNVGKSSLLNALCCDDVAIVTDQAGTTRDVVQRTCHGPGGVPLTLVDTAGLRQTNDLVEQKGIERSLAQCLKADHVWLLADATRHSTTESLARYVDHMQALTGFDPKKTQCCLNKIDTLSDDARLSLPDKLNGMPLLSFSALNQKGLQNLLETTLKFVMGEGDGRNAGEMGAFSARQRHIQALELGLGYLHEAIEHFNHDQADMSAESLRYAQQAWVGILGKQVDNEDLLGDIFRTFCIGK